MRLTSIEIENFCRHRQMRVTFCPHINVLAAPNDFGKSTLVEAIRAALLLPSTSKEGQTFVPWGTDATPKVILCFSLNGIDWRVSKSFGSTRGQAILEKCNNGQWSEEAKGRDVDGSLRKLLQWGVPEPGGKDAPKGWPKSYLVNALLGRQDDVAGLLELDLANDKLDSGRQLISKVLDSFSQDPLVTKLLKGLEDEIYGEFTSTGQLSRGANTKLSPLTREISKLEKEIDARVAAKSLSDQERKEAIFDAALGGIGSGVESLISEANAIKGVGLPTDATSAAKVKALSDSDIQTWGKSYNLMGTDPAATRKLVDEYLAFTSVE